MRKPQKGGRRSKRYTRRFEITVTQEQWDSWQAERRLNPASDSLVAWLRLLADRECDRQARRRERGAA